MLKKNFLLLVVLLLITIGCTPNKIHKALPNVQEPQKNERSKTLFINLDEALNSDINSEELRANKHDIIDGSIFLNDNDEVSFKGDILDEYSPITIKVGDNDEVSFTGKEYKISSMELKHGDLIEMKNKNGKVFLEMEVIE